MIGVRDIGAAYVSDAVVVLAGGSHHHLSPHPLDSSSLFPW
jgi:hypothetical protein